MGRRVFAKSNQIDYEIIKELKIDQLIIRGNRTKFDTFDKLQTMIDYICKNVIINEDNSIVHPIFAPIDVIINWMKSTYVCGIILRGC